jgi:hypothetical protein
LKYSAGCFHGLLSAGALFATISHARARADDRPSPWVLYRLLIGLAVFSCTIWSIFPRRARPADAFRRADRQRDRRAHPSLAGRRAIAARRSPDWRRRRALDRCRRRIRHPVATAEQQARRADDAIRASRPDLASGLLSSAFRVMPLNADYAFPRRPRHDDAKRPRPSRSAPALDAAIATDRMNAGYRYVARGMR